MSATPIPFVDLRAQHDEIRSELDAAIAHILDTSSFIGGPIVDRFEADFAAFCGARHAIGVSNGTDAVRIALQLVGVEAGTAIVTVSHTFIGTVEGAVQLGAMPLFVDIDRESRTMSPAALERFLEKDCERSAEGALRHKRSGRRVAAIVPVHLYGQSTDMAPILTLGERFGVPVVEDAAQAQGAAYRFPDGREVMCGAMGAVGAFSFYPGKNLGAIGEAGAIVTNDEGLARRARVIRDHGQAEKYVHLIGDGGNFRLDTIQAAVLGIKLQRLDSWNATRRRIAGRYAERLADTGLELPVEMPYATHIYHLYVIQHPERDRVRAELMERGIGAGLHYPIPLHLQPAFQGMELAGALPETERAAATCLSLPMFAHMTVEQADRVADALLAVAAPVLPVLATA